MTAYLTQPKELLRQMLARSASFQTAVGATGTTEQKITAALARVHSVAIEDFDSKCIVGGVAERPFVLVTGPQEFSLKNSSGHMLDNGQVWMLIEDKVASANAGNPKAAEDAFCLLAENIVSEVCSLQETDYTGGLTFPRYEEIAARMDARRSDELAGESADYYQMILTLTY